MNHRSKFLSFAALAAAATLSIAACGSSGSSGASSAASSAPSSASSAAPADSSASAAPTQSAASAGAESSAPSSAASAGSGSTPYNGSDTVAFLMPDQNSTRYVTYDIPSFEKVMKELCPNCKVIASDANADSSQQRSQAQAAIAQGAKAIVVDPVDAGAAGGWVGQAMAQGIKVISYDRPFSSMKLDYYVSFDNEVVGQMLAQPLIDHLKSTNATKDAGTGILIVNGSPTDAAAGLIKKGIHDVVDPSGIKVLAEFDTPDWVPAKAQAWVTSQIQRFGNKIKGIVAANDGTGTAAIAALKAANLSPMPQVTGNDATVAGVQLLLEGSMYDTISKPGEIEANAAAHVVVDLLQGKTPSAVPGGTETTLFNTPSQLFKPTVVLPADVQKDLVDTGYLKASELCTATYQAACEKYGVK